MSVLAMVMIQDALKIRPEEERLVRHPDRLFRTISSLRFSKKQFYEMFLHAQKMYIEGSVLPSLRQKPGELMLTELAQLWSLHGNIDVWLRNTFECLDPQHLEHWEPPIRLGEVGFTFFQELIYGRMKEQVKDTVLVLVHKEREGEQIDRALLKKILDMFVEMGLGLIDCYERDFEYFFLEDTANYYYVKTQQWFPKNSYFTYMVKVEESLKKERERVGPYLQISTGPKLSKIVQEKLGPNRKVLLQMEQSKCFELLRDNKVQDLSNMCTDFIKTNNSSDILGVFKKYLTDKITDLVKQVEDSASNTEVILSKIFELLGKYENYDKVCFQDSMIFKKMIKQAIDVAFEREPNLSAKFLVTLCDNILKKGCSGKVGDLDIYDALEKVMRLLACIRDRNTFVEHYEFELGRRLFSNEANRELEKVMLGKLKEQLEGKLTSRLDDMLSDRTIESRGLLKNPEESGIEFDVTVSNQNLPPLLLKGERSFKMPKNLVSHHGSDLLANIASKAGFCPPRLYVLSPEMLKYMEDSGKSSQDDTCKGVLDDNEKKMKQTGAFRRRTWLFFLGTCHINARFEAKNIELIGTTYQAALLKLFDGSDRLSCDEIIKQLNLPNDVVAGLLYSLSCGEYNILNKEPNNETFSTSDSFEVNLKFTDSREIIKLPMPNDRKMVVVDNRKMVVVDNEAERKPTRHQIDASIMYIMKREDVMDHTTLIKQCIDFLSSKYKCTVVDVQAIKKRIQFLIDDEQMERDQNNRNMYKYLR